MMMMNKKGDVAPFQIEILSWFKKMDIQWRYSQQTD